MATTLYTAEQAAKKLDCVKITVLRHAAAHDLGFRTVDGRLLGLSSAEIEQLRKIVRPQAGNPGVRQKKKSRKSL